MKLTSLSLVLLCAIALSTLPACKKDNLEADLASTGSVTQPTLSDKLKDSALAFSKDIYLWYTQIPASFNARSFFRTR